MTMGGSRVLDNQDPLSTSSYCPMGSRIAAAAESGEIRHFSMGPLPSKEILCEKSATRIVLRALPFFARRDPLPLGMSALERV